MADENGPSAAGKSIAGGLNAIARIVEAVLPREGLTAGGIRKKAAARRDARILDAAAERQIERIRQGVEDLRLDNLAEIGVKVEKLREENPYQSQGQVKDASWASMWYQKAQHATDDQVQMLWAKVLAGEAEAPGSFSKWTLNALENMSQEDIQALTEVASCTWRFGAGVQHLELVYWPSSRQVVPLKDYVLQRTGLVTGFGSPLIGQITVSRKRGSIWYFDEAYNAEFPDDLNIEKGTPLTLTLHGKEMIRLCDGKHNEAYKQDCLKEWRARGLQIDHVATVLGEAERSRKSRG